MDSTSAPLAGPDRMDPFDAFLAGTGVSPGIASGTARTIHSVDQFSTVRAGEILVCRRILVLTARRSHRHARYPAKNNRHGAGDISSDAW